jgi:hypothetical protein
MLEVIIRHTGSQAELAKITIENVSDDGDGEFANYSVRFGVEKGRSVGLHQRGLLNFPRKKYNVFALLLQALNTLDPSELEFDGEWDQRTHPSVLKLLRSRLWKP